MTVRSQLLQPFDVNMQDIKSIWESPDLQPALTKINSFINNGNIVHRIVGGDFALPEQFLHHVLLHLESAYICGGSLLNANWILTVRMFFTF